MKTQPTVVPITLESWQKMQEASASTQRALPVRFFLGIIAFVKAWVPQKISAGVGSTKSNGYIAQVLARKSPTSRSFLVTWGGTKNPRGAEIEGRRAYYARHGLVHTKTDGEEPIGTYIRIVENGGPMHDHQQIIVTVG